MNTSKQVALFAAVCILLSATGCSLIKAGLTNQTEDLNGPDDSSLASITDEELCAEEPKECYCLAYGFAPAGGSSYPDEEIWHDAGITEASALSPLSGISCLQMTYGKTDKIRFSVSSSLTEGNLRIVLLDEDLNIIHDFDVNGESSVEVDSAQGKTYEIRVAGEAAIFEAVTSREFIGQ